MAPCPFVPGGRGGGRRPLLCVDQKTLAELSGLSVPTIQRMEASSGNVRGVVDSLTKVVEALDLAGIELIGDGAPSPPRAARRAAQILLPETLTKNSNPRRRPPTKSRRSRRFLCKGAAQT